jgi:hypothetical protein
MDHKEDNTEAQLLTHVHHVNGSVWTIKLVDVRIMGNKNIRRNTYWVHNPSWAVFKQKTFLFSGRVGFLANELSRQDQVCRETGLNRRTA